MTTRQKNMRVVYTGSALALCAFLFFLYMLSIASRSNNPAQLMQTVGQVAGVVIGISIAMIIAGLVGKKT